MLNLIVIRTNQPKELSEFYELIGMNFEYHQHGKVGAQKGVPLLCTGVCDQYDFW